MKRFVAGAVAGSILASGLSVSYLLTDKKNRSKLVRDSKRLKKRSKVMINDLQDFF